MEPPLATTAPTLKLESSEPSAARRAKWLRDTGVELPVGVTAVKLPPM